MNPKKVIVCDLDGTLAVSKSTLSPAMSNVICQVLCKHFFVVVSGGAFSQFQKQFLPYLECESGGMDRLTLFPTNGSACYIFSEEKKEWTKVYDEPLTPYEHEEVFEVLKENLAKSGIDLSNPYGELVEDRGGQITISGRGQEAPIEIKEAWDPDQVKRNKIISSIKNKLSEFDIHIGGTTSIDITRKGIDKAYAIEKIKQILSVTEADIVFIGDALYEGGNDSAVKRTGVECIQTSGPDETAKILKQYT